MDASLENEVPYVARKVHATDKPIEPGTPLKREAEYEAKSREQWEKIEAAIGASREINKRIENTFSNTNGLVSPWVATLSDGTLAISVEYTVQERPKPRRDHQERSRDHQRSENGSRASGASERETIIKRPGPSFKKVEQALPGKAQGRVPHRLRGADKVSASAFEDKKFPVVFKKRKNVKTMGSCKEFYYNDEYQDGVPGGCKIGGPAPGTACTPALDRETWEEKLVSAGHVYVDESSVVEQPGGHWTNPNNIGVVETVVNEDHWEDYGLAKIPEDRDSGLYKWKLADDSGGYKDTDIEGTIAWEQIKNNVDNVDYEVNKQGAKTGVTSGHIHRIKDLDVHDTRAFKTRAEAHGGDSGGPMFRKVNGDVYIAGVLTAGDNVMVEDGCPFDNSVAMDIEYVEDQLGIVV